MARVISATFARKNFFKILDHVIYTGEEVIVEKQGAGRVRIVREKRFVNKILKKGKS